ncbi:hypothetical protein Pst134EB_026412 [Puccinia striiformis f. sp. tritici]|nr:hypothetical protein Pst134EB_026412 [Puccinia striiformis f. sp. tritici]
MDEQASLSAGQLQSELDSLRSLRRISLTQASAELDPDLPANNMSSSEQQQQQPTPELDDEPNPDLFWLPARLHPEIAPQEFKAFIEEATKPENLLRRTSSALGARRTPSDQAGLTRKKSMLSQLYDPTNDSSLSAAHRPEKPITRGYSMSSPRNLGRGAQGLESLTINDLQRLESIVLKKSSVNNDQSLDSQFHHLDLNDDQIRAVISRSLTIGGSMSGPGFNSHQLDPEAIDDSPLISRAPGHIIRRTARTKVRKTSLPGDGNGHRFPAVRRTQGKSSMATSHHPRTDSSTSNDSEETISNDIHSNRSSKSLTSDIDPPLTIEPISLLSNKLDHSSEDDQSIDSGSRPDSMNSNNSLLDSYMYEADSIEDQLTTPTAENTCGIDLSSLNISSSNLDFTIPHPIKYAGSPPDSSSPPTSSKPDALKVLTDLSVPLPHLTTNHPSSTSASTTSSSTNPSSGTPLFTAKSTPASSSGTHTSPPTSSAPPPPPPPTRPPPTLTKSSPLLSTPSTTNVIATPPPTPPPVAAPVTTGSVKEGKDKKRAWTKLGLSSAVSPSSKNKKGKAKDKDKQKSNNQQQEPQQLESSQNSSTQSPSSTVLSGSSSNPGTVAVKKESGFLSGLFGSKSRKNDSEHDKSTNNAAGGTPNNGSNQHKHPASTTGNGSTGGSGTGLSTDPSSIQSQQQQLINPTASGGYIQGRFMSFYRLPIHVERAVYRLSHIKLANPRRPLYEQVLISNLMFWYLGVINKSQQAASNPSQQQKQQAPSSSSTPSPSSPSSSSSPSSKKQSSTTVNGKSQPSNPSKNSGILGKAFGTNSNKQAVEINGKPSVTNKKNNNKPQSNIKKSKKLTAQPKNHSSFDKDSESSSSSDDDDDDDRKNKKFVDSLADLNNSSSSAYTSDDSDDNDSSSTDDNDNVNPTRNRNGVDKDDQDDDDDDEKPLGNRILKSKHNLRPGSHVTNP